MCSYGSGVAILCAGIVFAGAPSALPQEATSANLPENLETGEPAPPAKSKKKKAERQREVVARTQTQTQVPVKKQTPSTEEPITPATRTEKKARAKKREPSKHANITGSGVCLMLVDIASGTVTKATMTQSTGNRVLDKVTTDTFRRWRFKPGSVSQVRVPVTYE